MKNERYPYDFLKNALERNRKVVLRSAKRDGDLKYFRSGKNYGKLISLYGAGDFRCTGKSAMVRLDSISYDIEGTGNTTIRFKTGSGEMDFILFIYSDINIDKYLEENGIADYSEGPPVEKKSMVGRKFKVCYRYKMVEVDQPSPGTRIKAEVLTGIKLLP
jgi:hypothetical protein